ncbi:hypothetical protein AGDE_15646 [Angomonas deanei]|uniref:Uncharacterized protein n=1 Tax=Angomonas deanei TaxID=59799 RepID=A0A7G2CJL0_9TRYP|nr:hypothetical protein AGDE_15646 [Angomonas deanei]CAD2219579.1 hypothetical protein, conserved [Angomonas deanei]|eukprot:EPY18712.1 hypothetical protein AGDE_15646 [Angomonas deanei]
MTFQCNLASECARGGVLPPLLATSSSNAGSSSSGSSSKRNERVTVPCTVRYHSYVDPNELAHDMPVSKDFQRPFERWGCAHSLCRRVFTAAAIYAWKLIFSHTPHDDYKQQQLRTDEERHQRLLRVDERNRSILACFCVRSEREWLREASKDLSFVGQIWNPKNSLNPKDPNFEQQCREMFTFVEDFLFQCFPTVNGLDEIPSFLVGAGMYSMLGEVFHVEEEVRAGGSMMEQLKRQSEALNLSNRSELVTNRVRDGSMTSLTAFQQATIHRYELVSLLNRLSSWLLIGNEAEIFNQSVHHANSNDEEQTNMFHPVAPQESIEAQLVRTINDDTKLASSVLGDTMREGTGNNMFATSSPSPADNLQLAVKGESGTFSLYAGGVTPTAPTTSSINFPSALTGHSTPSNRNPPNESKATEDNIANPILVRVPGDFIVANNNNENFNQNTYYVKHARFIKEREEGIYNILVGALKSSGTAVGSTVLQADRDEVTIVYPKKFLTLIAQRLTFELFGLQLNLDICEDLDVVE